MFYFVNTFWWMRRYYKECIWQMPDTEKVIYLTFDDGPHPLATPFVLNELDKYNAKATFFCIGKNVMIYQDIYKDIIGRGHKVGNHTQNHLNGWKTADKEYLDNIFEAKQYIDSDLFRPPYGRITKFQLQQLQAEKFRLTSVMWSVLSGDFDAALSPEDCLLNVLRNADKGAIVVFHDSEKAFEKLQYVLPKVLQHYTEKGFRFETVKVR